MSFKVLSLDDRQEWQERVAALPLERQDIHFLPEMLEVYKLEYGWEPLLALYEDDESYVLQPFLRKHDGSLRHAFNFGGPVGSHNTTILTGLQYQMALENWRQRGKITKEYCSINPMIFLEQIYLVSGVKLSYVKEIVWVDLNELAFRTTTRHMITKAEKNNVVVRVVADDPENLFSKMYQETMTRRNAAEHWRFPSSFFTHFAGSLKGKHTRMFAYVNGVLESGCLIVHSHDKAYYHFAGSLGNFPSIGVNHKLVSEAANHMKSIGCKTMHLGGGVTADPNDGLMLFKRGFSKYRAPLFVYEIK